MAIHPADTVPAPHPSAQPGTSAATLDATLDARLADARGRALDASAFAAMARRDRARLAEATAEQVRLHEWIAALEGSRPMRAARQARRAAQVLPPWLRTAIRRTLLGGREVPPQAGTDEGAAAPEPVAAARPVALFLDERWPQPDRDAGSMEIVNLFRALQSLGFDVHFVAAQETGSPCPALDALVQAGVRAWSPSPDDPAEAFLARFGPSVDLCVLCRVYGGGPLLEAVQRSCGKARLLFCTIDLHWVREERRARVTGDAALMEAAREVRRREEELVRACDATVVVSRSELDLLAEGIPDALVVELPLARPIAPPLTPFAARRGIGFIGGFAHAPNVDAVTHFLDDVWPVVLRGMPDAELSIVGAGLPAGLLDGRPGRVRALGHVPDVGPWFESLRLTVAPLRFGAGAKGKVASSLAAGVPCVASPVAAEGMKLDAGGEGGSGVLVAADPEAFAAHVQAVHEDPALWARLSTEGLAYAQATLSPEAWRARLVGTLRVIGVLDGPGECADPLPPVPPG